ncbi:MAG: OsmC family peroxiredoxin [Candidatus Zixiibacteriota bacterium]|nr:MAG: OsmC family peroxiredoxin [candidate division Zixibacteria bacterium]
MLKTKLNWTGGIRFEGVGRFGHKIVTDGSRKAGGEESGHTPTELLLWGIAGCTGVDVVRILQKQRQQLTGLEIEVIGHQPETYPKPFEHIEIVYTFRGRKLDPKKVEQAIELSESKYCTVSQTVKAECRVTTAFTVVEE